ncbi:MAG: FAD-dependent oxidoreductase [Acidobacteria bacterium]|nr:FAD-dependent oxidoreductase [Acidobacteriota bacterium]
MIDRRELLKGAGAAAFFTVFTPRGLKALSARELRADVVVIGGGTGGVAAALAALRLGARVILTEETDWPGGQLTSQAVPPDEHPWIESFGCTRTYRNYRNAVRDYYRNNYPLSEAARSVPYLNPGNGSVSRITHEPRVSLAVLEALLAPYASGDRLTVLLRHRPVAADVDGARIRSVTVRSLVGGSEITLSAPYFLDATETGELLPLTKTEYVTGFESRAQTGELHAPASAQPLNMQAVTVCFAIDHRPGENHVIDKPAQYDFWRNHEPKLAPPWPGRLITWNQPHPETLKPRAAYFDPERERSAEGLNFFIYRRILDKKNFAPGAVASDISLVNWPMNDYFGGPLFEVSESEAARHLEAAKQLSLSLLYWMQTEAPRPDGRQGWPGLRLRADVVGTEDGLAKYPYIRESRRIRAEFTVIEQHVGAQARAQLTGRKPEELASETFKDSIGVGSYRIDLHMSTGGDNYIDISSLPFQIPLGALIPVRMENLLPACKNIGTTHITNGCYRLHPVEWNIGEAAGALAAHAHATGQTPRGVRNDEKRLADFLMKLRGLGIETEWPRLRPR